MLLDHGPCFRNATDSGGSNPSQRVVRTTLRIIAASALLLAVTPLAGAQSVVSVSPDVTIPLFPGDLTTADHAVAVSMTPGIFGLQSLGTIPESADVIGYAEIAGSKLLSFDATVSLSGGVVARPGDVVSWNGSVHSIAFDADGAGLPNSVQVDAVAIASTGGLLLSFDSDVSLPGALHVADEDLVRWNGTAFSLALDGSAAGMSRALDVDAVDDLGGSSFLVSFDSSGSVGSISFADEDVLRYASGTWSLERDGSVVDADWGAADLDAMQMVPEPDRGPMLAIGGLLLTTIASGLRRPRAAAAGGGPAAGLLVCLMASLLAQPAEASDGVLEIHQTCAVNGGCFPGDTAGFPVTITASGSYRLSSNLTVPNENTDGIAVITSHVHIDLNQFAILGPVVCSGTPIACTPTSGTGSGIESVFPHVGIRVENGVIRGMGNSGVDLDQQAEVVDLRVGSNRNDGVDVGTDSVVTRSVVFQNGDDGILAQRGTVVVDNAVSRNGFNGIRFNQTSSAAGLVASGNSVYQNEGSGMLAAGGSTITGNTIYDNGVNGISAGSGSVVNGNMIASNTDTGLSNNSATGIGYTDNTITSNGLNVPLGPTGTGLLDRGGNSCGGTAICP